MPSVNVVIESPHFKLLDPESPIFEVTKSIPKGIAPQLEAAVKDFMLTSHMPQGVDLGGFYYQTLQAIAQSTILNGAGEVWLGLANGELWTYILAHISNDVDGRLAYTVRQAWVREDQRGKPWVREAWQRIRQRAKDCFCSHLVIYSSRGNDLAYCRFLGKGFHPYESLLKEEL